MARRAVPGTGGRSRLGIQGILAVFGIPVLVAILLAWGLAAPIDHLDRITAAVVNNDQPVTINGQTVPVGRELAAGLIGGEGGSGAPDDPGADATASPAPAGPNFTWVLTNSDDAASGLADGTYAAVVTIPSEFSADVTSISGPAADAVNGTITVTTTPATAFLDPALTSVVVQAAVATLNSSLTGRYLQNVYEGFNQINSSVAQAADGAAQLATGAASLSEGAGSLSEGATTLASGLDALDAGAASLASGLSRLAASVQPLPAQTQQLAAGSAQVAGALDAGAAALDTVTAEFAAIVDTICQEPGPLCTRATRSLQKLESAQSDVSALATGADEVAAGNAALAAGMPPLVAGVDSSSSGADEVAAGAGSSAEGGTSVAQGADEVASGAANLDSGAAELSSGLAQAVEQIPTYSSSDITTLSAVVAQPVQATMDLPASGTSSVPLFAVIALWTGGIVASLVRRSVPTDLLLTARSTASLTRAAGWRTAVIGAGQGALVAAALLGFLDADPAALLSFAAASVAAGAVFALVTHGLAALLEGSGRTVAAVIAVVALVVGTASTAPAALETLAALVPTGPGRTLMLAALGVGGWVPPLLALALWALIGIGLLFAGIASRRRVHGRSLATG